MTSAANVIRPYRVSWVIEVEASSPEDAARAALKELRDPEPGGPTIFDVTPMVDGPLCRIAADSPVSIDVEDLVPATNRSVS
jgi:hypothetical protein